MIRAPWPLIVLAFSSTLLAGGMPPGPAGGQERPRYGGELVFLVPSEPPHSAKVRGWTITPSHFLNQQLDTVWLAE